MLSHVRATKEMALIEPLYSLEGYQCRWGQLISKEGEVCGTGYFQQRATTHTKSGNWADTLKKRITAMNKKKRRNKR